MKLFSNRHRPTVLLITRGRIMAIALLILTGLNALAVGTAFMVKPSGRGMRMTTDYLKYSPFRDFFFPGLLLFTFIGLFSVVVAFLTVKKISCHALLVVLQRWILTGCIIIQVLLVRDLNLLHIIFLIIGMSLIFIGSVLSGQKGLFLKSEIE